MRKRFFFIVLMLMLGLFPAGNGLSVEDFSDLATAAAAAAAAWSAYEARKSVGTAVRAADIAEKTLLDTRESARYSRFQQEFTLMLAQHNQYHADLTKFLNGTNGEKLMLRVLGNGNTNIWLAAQTLYQNGCCSPYMRVLYHLLKLIDTEFYGGEDDLKGRKKYSSLVRSLIRNDVLMLLAVNACYHDENPPGLHEDFVYFHRMLDKFDFFEHLDLKSFTKKSENGKGEFQVVSLSCLLNETLLDPIKNIITNCIPLPESEWEKEFYNHKPTYDVLFSVSYIYENPRRTALINSINGADRYLEKELIDAVNNLNLSASQQFLNLKMKIDKIITPDNNVVYLRFLTESIEDHEILFNIFSSADYEKIKYEKNGTVSFLSTDLKNSLEKFCSAYRGRELCHAPFVNPRRDKLLIAGMAQLTRDLNYLNQLCPDGTPPPGLTVKTYPLDG